MATTNSGIEHSAQSFLDLRSPLGPMRGLGQILSRGCDRYRQQRFTSDQIKVMNKQLFEEMEAKAERWHNSVGFLLTWQRLPDRRACRIIATHPLDLGDEASAGAAKQWAAPAPESMFNAMNAELRDRATSIKKLTPQKVPTPLAPAGVRKTRSKKTTSEDLTSRCPPSGRSGRRAVGQMTAGRHAARHDHRHLRVPEQHRRRPRARPSHAGNRILPKR